jgi:predicted DNA-binding transcriptional regulator AlpA
MSAPFFPLSDLTDHQNFSLCSSSNSLSSSDVSDDLVFWSISECIKGTSIGKTTWYKLIAQGRAPKPIKITSKRSVWVKAEVLAFRKALIEKSRSEGGSK